MKSLLKFITTEDRARELMEICTKKGLVLQHIKHQEPLTEEIIREGGFSVNFGGYGSYSRLGLGTNFGSKWEIDGLDAPSRKGFYGVDVCFGAGLDEVKQKAIAEYINTQGGSVVDGDEGNCDLCILPEGAADEKNLLELIGQIVDGAKGFLVVSVDEFLQVIPAIKKPRPRATKAAKLSDELKQLQKQLQERNLESIEAALQALQGRDDDIDLLVQGVSVGATGELDRGSKFKGSGPALEFLDLALTGLLSQAGENSEAARLRCSIKVLRCFVKSLPRLKGFDALEELDITISRSKDNEETLKVSDLSSFGPMPSLRKLRIVSASDYGDKSLVLRSLCGLEASALEEIDLADSGLEDIDALECSKRLKIINLSGNPGLSSISALKNCATIESINLNGTCISTLEPLLASKDLVELHINECRQLKSLRGIDAPSMQSFELRWLDLATLDGLDRLTGLRTLVLSGLHNLKDLSPIANLSTLEELELDSLTSFKELPSFSTLSNLHSVTIQSCDEASDIGQLKTASALRKVFIRECPKVKVGPSIWPDGLQELDIQQTKLQDLGICPASLTELCITNNAHLKSLAGLRSCNNLNVPSWGFDLSGCFKLQDLDGLSLPKLAAISIPETLCNLGALKRYPDLQITVVAGQGQQKGYRTLVEDIPAALGDALNSLEPEHLIVKTEWGAELQKISGIGRVKSLKTLDLSECDLVDITGIAPLDKLEHLKVQPRTELSKSLGKATFDSKGQIDKLRLRLLAGV